jgi:hypothetical protein
MHRFTAHFGHRATFIWLISVCWVSMGAIILVGSQPPIDHLFHTYLPIPVRVAFWVFPAVLSSVVARSAYEWIAFPLLSLPAAERLASYWVAAGFSMKDPSNATWVSWELAGRGMAYLVVILVMWLVATWPDPIAIDFGPGFNDDGDEEESE